MQTLGLHSFVCSQQAFHHRKEFHAFPVRFRMLLSTVADVTGNYMAARGILVVT